MRKKSTNYTKVIMIATITAFLALYTFKDMQQQLTEESQGVIESLQPMMKRWQTKWEIRDGNQESNRKFPGKEYTIQ